MEQAERTDVEIFPVECERFLARLVAQHHRPDRLLGHHVVGDQRAFRAVHLEAGSCVPDREGVVALGDGAGLEPDHPHGPVIEPGGRHAGRLGQGDHLHGIVVEHEAQGIRIVYHDVQDHPAPRLRPVEAPAPEVRRQGYRVHHPRGDRPADPPGADRLAHGPVRPGVPEMVVGSHDDSGRPARLHHLPRLGHRERQGFLAEHVAAGAGGGQGLLPVKLVGGGDVDRIDVRCVHQRVERGGGPGDAVRRREGSRALRIGAHDRDHLSLAAGADRVQQVLPGDRARPDEAPADGHATCLLNAVPQAGAPRLPLAARWTFVVCSPRSPARFRSCATWPVPPVRRSRANHDDGDERRSVLAGVGHVVDADHSEVPRPPPGKRTMDMLQTGPSSPTPNGFGRRPCCGSTTP